MFVVKMIRLGPPWGSSQKIKNQQFFFSEIAKIIFDFIIS